MCSERCKIGTKYNFHVPFSCFINTVVEAGAKAEVKTGSIDGAEARAKTETQARAKLGLLLRLGLQVGWAKTVT